MTSTNLSFTTSLKEAEKFKRVFRLFHIPYYSTEYYDEILFFFENNERLREKVDALIDLSFGEED